MTFLSEVLWHRMKTVYFTQVSTSDTGKSSALTSWIKDVNRNTSLGTSLKNSHQRRSLFLLQLYNSPGCSTGCISTRLPPEWRFLWCDNFFYYYSINASVSKCQKEICVKFQVASVILKMNILIYFQYSYAQFNKSYLEIKENLSLMYLRKRWADR